MQLACSGRSPKLSARAQSPCYAAVYEVYASRKSNNTMITYFLHGAMPPCSETTDLVPCIRLFVDPVRSITSPRPRCPARPRRACVLAFCTGVRLIPTTGRPYQCVSEVGRRDDHGAMDWVLAEFQPVWRGNSYRHHCPLYHCRH